MSYFHQIKTVKDEEQMLKKILSIQTQIRARREKERLARNSQNEKYTKIFEPITRTLKDLSDIPTTSTTTTLHPNHAENLIDFKDPKTHINITQDIYRLSSEEETHIKCYFTIIHRSFHIHLLYVCITKVMD